MNLANIVIFFQLNQKIYKNLIQDTNYQLIRFYFNYLL